MISILAQHAPAYGPNDLYIGLGLLLTALLLVVLIRKVFAHDPPLHKEYVSRAEHLTHQQWCTAANKELADKLEKDRQALSDKVEEDYKNLASKMDAELGRERGARKTIHQEITALQGSVGIVQSQNAMQSVAIAELKSDQSKTRDRIDEVPQRTITLLRTAGIIK